MDKLLRSQSALATEFSALKVSFNKLDANRRTRGYVSKKLESLETVWTLFQENHAKLRLYDDFVESSYVSDSMYGNMEDDYSIFAGELSDIIHSFDRAEQLTNSPPNPNPSPIPAPSIIRLPQISLPTFSGSYESWSSFHDMFVSLIHSNATLTNVQKLHYLKSNLRDQAANLLRHTEITNDNYDIAWEALKTRYANKRILVNTQLKLLINQPPCHVESATGIRNIIDTTQDCLNALRCLNVDVDNWDPILLFMLIQKISAETHAAWEQDQEGVTELSSYDAFIEFMENRFRMLESLATRTSTTSHAKQPFRQLKAHAVVSSAETINACTICSGQHYVRSCPDFIQFSVADRRTWAKHNRVCFNCLSPGHLVQECKNRKNCLKCNKRHHTLLHESDINQPEHTQAHQSNAPCSSPKKSAQVSTTENQSHNPFGNKSVASHIAASSTSVNISSSPPHVLLATAMVTAVSSTGSLIPLRALIDQGSQVTFLSENASQLLRLKSTPTDWSLTGIGCTSAGRVRNVVQLQLRSPHHADFTLTTTAFIIKNVTGMLPPARCSYNSWPHITDITLADPSFNEPGAIDLLIGADVYADIIRPGLRRGPVGAPIAQSTVFGWILSGSVTSSDRYEAIQSHLCTLHTCIDIDSRLKTFWEIEHSPITESIHTEEETQCEKHYAETHSRASDGRYIVRLPLRDNLQLGESRATAHQRFLQIERRLEKNASLRKSYNEFMREYIALGHMKPSRTCNTQQLHYYIPHHAVFKENSTTTKVRVVFDASCKSANGVALNEMMMIGPRIQDDLSVILLRWRRFPIAFTADVEKMYRQILVHSADQPLQHILWRESPSDPIIDFALQTVTYGTSCAPHLAVRTLRQMAIDHETTHPAAAKMAREDFYVDDLMSGAYTSSGAITVRREMCDLMSKGGLNLRKWVSNHSPLWDDIPSTDRETQHLNIEINTVTALGIVWNPTTDKFHFNLKLPEIAEQPTKRNILSDTSKLFDPLGWLAPIIVRPKMLMQRLWLQGVSWDEPVPDAVAKHWEMLRKDLFNVRAITIDRWMQHHNTGIELHGFSDASNFAYAAVIYARIMQPDGKYHTTLLTAKTRVAPLKQVTIPRLELCGAVLVAELLQSTQSQLQIADTHVHAWTDSSIVLHWIRSQPCRWKTFVANRVSTIQQIIPMANWHHVPTADNPADCASRGMDTIALKSFSLWWNGPSWLIQAPETWPSSKYPLPLPEVTVHNEQRLVHLVTPTVSQPSFSSTFLQSFSSLNRLLRVFAYCKRFMNRNKRTLPNDINLAASELRLALEHFIITSQSNIFGQEINMLRNKKSLSPHSKLISLKPFLDENGILRVGGRLKNSHLSNDEKHPIILHNQCHLTTLIIRQCHFATMHGGTQLVLGLIRKTYWIINARDTVRSQIHRCITCHRFNATSATQLMGDLPHPRVNITRAFTHTGVDYAGPIDLRMSKGRGNASYKGYISLFICLCTKAIHIEAVSDLTSAGFIAAYRRFVARRGLPAHIYSDNGTNFVGAQKTLRKMHDDIMLQVKSDIINNVTNAGTEWHFIPPSSPHFGGLWEAGVKSLKHHLKRSIGNTKLTYEELSTLITQIEACLNSRPLTQLTSDPDDFTALTPGHFLTGNALLAAPDKSTEPMNVSVLSRWQLVQRLYQNISSRWQSEYLSRLQQRPKWTKTTHNLQVGDLVLLKDPSQPPSDWPLARVTDTHPGTDGLVRVVTVRTVTSSFKRCITKICPLPIT